jgi:hypothetical protein
MAPSGASTYHLDMAEIIVLGTGESPPEDGVWLLLEQGDDELFKAQKQQIIGAVTRHDYHSDRWPLDEALARAKQDAAEFKISVIYVRRTNA